MTYIKKVFGLTLLSITLFLLFFIACTTRQTPPLSIPPPKTGEIEAPVQAKWQIDWEKLTLAARKEGKVIIYMTAPSSTTRDFIVKSMKEKFGVDVELVAMSSGLGMEKVSRERKAGIFNLDIQMGGWDTVASFDEQRLLEPLDKTIFLPEVLDEKMWMERGVFLNKDHSIAGGFAGINPLIVVNTQLVKSGEIKSLDELLDLKWKGKIIIYDPTVVGTGNATIRTIMLLQGEGFIKKLVEQTPTLSRDGRVITEWLARGKFAINLGPSFGIIKEFMEMGTPLAYVLPAEGAFISVSPGPVTLLKNAPHPNAAGLFINWILTREAQAEFARAQDTASRRVDVTSEHLVPERRPRPGFRYIRDFDQTAQENEERTKRIRELFKPVM